MCNNYKIFSEKNGCQGFGLRTIEKMVKTWIGNVLKYSFGNPAFPSAFPIKFNPFDVDG